MSELGSDDHRGRLRRLAAGAAGGGGGGDVGGESGLFARALLMPISSFSSAALISLLTRVPPMGLIGLRGSSSRSWKRIDSGSRSMSSPGMGFGV